MALKELKAPSVCERISKRSFLLFRRSSRILIWIRKNRIYLNFKISQYINFFTFCRWFEISLDACLRSWSSSDASDLALQFNLALRILRIDFPFALFTFRSFSVCEMILLKLLLHTRQDLPEFIRSSPEFGVQIPFGIWQSYSRSTRCRLIHPRSLFSEVLSFLPFQASSVQHFGFAGIRLVDFHRRCASRRNILPKIYLNQSSTCCRCWRAFNTATQPHDVRTLLALKLIWTLCLMHPTWMANAGGSGARVGSTNLVPTGDTVTRRPKLPTDLLYWRFSTVESLHCTGHWITLRIALSIRLPDAHPWPRCGSYWGVLVSLTQLAGSIACVRCAAILRGLHSVRRWLLKVLVVCLCQCW